MYKRSTGRKKDQTNKSCDQMVVGPAGRKRPSIKHQVSRDRSILTRLSVKDAFRTASSRHSHSDHKSIQQTGLLPTHPSRGKQGGWGEPNPGRLGIPRQRCERPVKSLAAAPMGSLEKTKCDLQDAKRAGIAPVGSMTSGAGARRCVFCDGGQQRDAKGGRLESHRRPRKEGKQKKRTVSKALHDGSKTD
jgi:hypothetical protein